MRRLMWISVLSIAAASVLTACDSSSPSLPPTALKPAKPTCTPAERHPTIVLSYLSPTPRISVAVGSIFVVSVPPWHWGHATEISTHGRTVRQVCSIGLNDGGRWAEFQAVRLGHGGFKAGVSPPSNAMAPSWSGYVTVTREK